MSETEFDTTVCESCGQPLFLSREECRKFIENKMKNGYIVCSCCGFRHTAEQAEKNKKPDS
jgi:RNase P subunit RPR2